jgi:hypothetical protein
MKNGTGHSKAIVFYEGNGKEKSIRRRGLIEELDEEVRAAHDYGGGNYQLL